MSLDVYLEQDGHEVYWSNITHNLNKMAEAAGIYKALWRPEEIGIERASEVAAAVAPGLLDMMCRPAHYEQFNSPNGWGLYRNFVPWLVEYLIACNRHPDAIVRVSR